jgi:hypothetical protein
MDDPLYLEDRLDDQLESFFQLMVMYTHFDDHIEEPLKMLLASDETFFLSFLYIPQKPFLIIFYV